MNIPNSLLLTYQAEYETTPDLTISDLCQKYNIETKQLKGYTKWQKRNTETTETSKLPKSTETNKLPETTKPSNSIVIVNEEDLLKDIDTFKSLAMTHALKFMRNDVEFAEVKEFKDMVSIVGTIENSLKDNKPENTINIAIQNIVKDFKDDC